MSTSRPVYTSTAEGFRDAKEIAGLRPMAAPKPRTPRKPTARPVVASEGMCFCGERFSDPGQFARHVRTCIGKDLAITEGRRAYARRYWRERRLHDAEWRERRNARDRERVRDRDTENARKRQRYATDPEYRAKRKAEVAEYKRRPESRERENARKRDRWATDPDWREQRERAKHAYDQRVKDDPEYRARQAARQRERRARLKTEREAVST